MITLIFHTDMAYGGGGGGNSIQIGQLFESKQFDNSHHSKFNDSRKQNGMTHETNPGIKKIDKQQLKKILTVI